jgi:hypothetical protein
VPGSDDGRGSGGTKNASPAGGATVVGGAAVVVVDASDVEVADRFAVAAGAGEPVVGPGSVSPGAVDPEPPLLQPASVSARATTPATTPVGVALR